jgi:hypothetical protein
VNALIPCYCHHSDQEIHDAVHAAARDGFTELPDHLLINDCCWRRVYWALRRFGKLEYDSYMAMLSYRGSLFTTWGNHRLRGTAQGAA